MKIKFKRLHPEAVAPKRAHAHDAGWDLTALHVSYDPELKIYVIHTGIGLSIPPGFVGLIFPRSSARNYSLILANCVGVIDAGYIGDISFSFRPVDGNGELYKKGDRIGQIVILPLPAVEMEETDDLGETARGTKGHGSTGA